jgi:hypothetical protein
MTELHRKQQEKKKTARSSLLFDSPPPAKFRKFKTPFSPPRTAPDIIGATQADEDFERDSLASQSSRSTARIRLQEKYVEVATLYKDEMSPEGIKERNQGAHPRHCHPRLREAHPRLRHSTAMTKKPNPRHWSSLRLHPRHCLHC